MLEQREMIQINKSGWDKVDDQFFEDSFDILDYGAFAHEQLRFRHSYVNEGFKKHNSWRGTPIVMYNRKVSTFINELINTRFVIDKVIEDSTVDDNDTSNIQLYSPLA